MEEKELFKEIRPLIEQYREYANQEIPDMWEYMVEDIKISEKSREVGKVYTADRELEIMKRLEVMDARRKLVEELIEIREVRKEEMRSIIFEKVSAFVNDEKEKINKEIEEKRQSLEEEKEEKRKKLEEKQRELKEKEQVKKDMNKRRNALTKYLQLMEQDLGKEDKVYMAVGEEKIQVVREKENLSRDINALQKECETLKCEYEEFIIENNEGLQEAVKRLSDFEEIYGNIDFENEDAINHIWEIIENNEVNKEEFFRLTEDDVEVIEPSPILTMDDIQDLRREEEEQRLWELYNDESKKQQEESKKQQEELWKEYDKKNSIPKIQELREKLNEKFAQIEEGNEDFILPSYIRLKENIMECRIKKQIEKYLENLEGLTLLDIYEKQLAYMDENSLSRKEIEKVVEELKIRKAQGTKEQGTKPKGAKPEGTKPETKVKGGRVFNESGTPIDDIETIRAMQERQILKEELEQRLEELKEGNEDLVNDSYLLLEQDLRNREDIENILKSLEGKTIKDIYEGMLEQAKTPEEKGELESIINELNAREKQLIEESNIVLEIKQAFINLERGNEDLLHILYHRYKQACIDEAIQDKNYAEEVLTFLEKNTLSGFYKDILDDLYEYKKELEEGTYETLECVDDIQNIKDIIAKLEIRNKHRMKSTTIVVEPKTGLIKIAIKGREKGIKFDNLLELMKQGKELQEGELISRFGINRCDPTILAALTQIGEKFPGHKNLLDEYINSFNYGTDEIDDIVYDFNNESQGRPENYKEILKAYKKYSKLGEKYGKATIEKTGKEGIWSKLRDFFSDRKQRRLESKEAKEYRTNRFRKSKDQNEGIEEPVKKRDPRAFMKKMQEKAKKGKNEGIDMSEAIEKLQAINQEMNNQPVVEEEEEVL